MCDFPLSSNIGAFEAEHLEERLRQRLGKDLHIPGSQVSSHRGVNRIITGVQQLLAAPSPAQLEALAPLLKEDVIWDAPAPLLGFVQSKAPLLAGLRLGAALGSWSLEPMGVTVRPLGKYHQVTLSGHLVASPALTLPLLPRHLSLVADVHLLVQGSLEEGQIAHITIKLHNLPELPLLLRLVEGTLLGGAAAVGQRLWGRGSLSSETSFYTYCRSTPKV